MITGLPGPSHGGRRLVMWRKAGFDFPGYGGELRHEKPLESGFAALG
jgi:hypothetical protein